VSWRPPPVGARATWTRTVTDEDVELYARITGDRNPLHFDEGFAAATKFGRLVVQGGLATGLFNALVAMRLPGAGTCSSIRSGTTRLPSSSATRSPPRPK
jgi:acyl dehydratase